MGCLARTTDATPEQVKKIADDATRTACEATALLKKNGLHKQLSPEAQEWATTHEAWDVERAAQPAKHVPVLAAA